MNTIENQTFDEERALYNLKVTNVIGCRFEGAADGESVLNFFEAMGAPHAAEKLQRVMESREVSNILNRRNNCMIANMDKSFDASIRQIEAIRKLRESGELEKLSGKNRETAELRLKYPSDSLEELAGRVGISKSAMYHRLRKIQEICGKLLEKQQQP